MPLSIQCPGCQTAFALGEQLRGKKVRCKKCGRVFAVDEAPPPTSEQDPAGGEGSIQQQQQLAVDPIVCEEEEPTAPPRRGKDRDELLPIPPLRRSRRGLIFGFITCGVCLFLLGGAAVLAILVYGRYGGSWGQALEQLDSDFRGSWPVPTQAGADFPKDTTVTLHVAGVDNESIYDAVVGKAGKLADGGRGGTASVKDGGRMTILVTPVHNSKTYADKIDFGTVRRVNGRIISVVAHKIEGPPANADALTKAIHHLKSPNSWRRSEAARSLKKMAPNERRSEVAQALHDALEKEARGQDLSTFTRQEIVEALAVWGNKDSVPALLNALKDLPEHDPFTRQAIFRLLARFKDERACEPLAHYLEDFATSHDAAEALKSMGSIAEKAVLKRLQHPDASVRREVCELLQVIGTKESIPALEKVAAKGTFAGEAREAIQAIKTRQKAASR